MRLLDISYPEPAMNLALDEVLLNSAEAGKEGESLRFWESPVSFVVLGVSQRAADLIDLDACKRDGVAVLRRASAGGCVIQGPGCLNFNLVLSQEARPEVRTIHDSYCYVLCRVREALAELGFDCVHDGISDLTYQGRKFSGNAQKRKRRYILHHGTLLYNMECMKMRAYLYEPADRPDYRGARSHAQFVANLPLSPQTVKARIARRFGFTDRRLEAAGHEQADAAALAEAKYGDPAWTFRR